MMFSQNCLPTQSAENSEHQGTMRDFNGSQKSNPPYSQAIMHNKINYFTHRVRALEHDLERFVLGEREVKTLLTVLDIEDGPLSLGGKFIVDLGCGDQHLRKSFESRGARYHGIDVQDCNLEIDPLPIGNGTVDIVVSMAVIEHLRDPGHFLAEIKRILKCGGTLWMDTPDIEACGNKFWNDPTHVHPYTRASMRTLLEMSGFEDVLITPNYRCKKRRMYSGSEFSFFRARYLMPLRGMSNVPVPESLKGSCSGIFALARKLRDGHHKAIPMSSEIG